MPTLRDVLITVVVLAWLGYLLSVIVRAIRNKSE